MENWSLNKLSSITRLGSQWWDWDINLNKISVIHKSALPERCTGAINGGSGFVEDLISNWSNLRSTQEVAVA